MEMLLVVVLVIALWTALSSVVVVVVVVAAKSVRVRKACPGRQRGAKAVRRSSGTEFAVEGRSATAWMLD